MTINTESVIEFYQNLLIIQYNQKEKARAEVALHVKNMMADGLISKVQDGYDIETAVGIQLDVIGKYIGKDRAYVSALLNDDDYRFILKLKIVQNNSSHSHKAIDDGLHSFFSDELIMSASDDMSIVYFVDSSSLTKAEIALAKKVLPRPMGVKLIGLIKKDKKMFGFTTYDKTSVSALSTGFTDYDLGFNKSGETLTYSKVIN